MATRKEEPYGRSKSKKKMHKLMVETGVLSIDQASEWGDTIAPLENIMKFLHSVLIHHDKNDGNDPNCDPTAYPTRKSITNLACNDTSALMRLLFALFYGESLPEVKKMMEKRSETRRWDQIIRTVYLLSSLGRGIRNVGGGTVQRLIAAHASAQNMGGNLFQLLQLFGITPLKSTTIQGRNNENGC